MTNNIYIYSAVACITAAFCASLLIPLIIRICRMRSLFDQPDSRKIHRSNNIPRLGGLSFLPAVAVAVMTAASLSGISITDGANVGYSLLCIATGGMVIYLTGMIDDIIGLPPMLKMAFQTVAACLLAASGTYSDVAHATGLTDNPAASFALTVFIVVYVCNAVNFIDGIDGQCGCLSLVAMALFFVFSIALGRMTQGIIAAATTGVLTVFLAYNMFGRTEKATKIFMGDTGSLSLSYAICFFSLPLLPLDSSVTSLRLSPSATVAAVMAVPMLDLIKVAIMRTVNHKSIFYPDKSHIHHRLMDAGLSQHQALSVTIITTIAYILADNTMAKVMNLSQIIAVNAAAWAVGTAILHNIIKRKNTKAHSRRNLKIEKKERLSMKERGNKREGVKS